MTKVSVIIVAGGSGSRMGTSIKKQYLKIQGKEILAHSVGVFEAIEAIDEIIVVTHEEDKAYVSELVKHKYNYEKVTHIVAGGAERQYSVANGLSKVAAESRYVLVHDAARPLVEKKVIQQVISDVILKKACIVAVPVKDTIKIAAPNGCVEATPSRDTLWSVQTPQAFEKDLLVRAYEQARETNLLGTDDSMLVEAIGEQVFITEGSYTNIKITTPEDLIIAERLLVES